MLNCVEMCNFSPHFHAVQHYFFWLDLLLICHIPKGRFFWYVSNVLLLFASKHAQGMSLRYDAICTLGIGDAALWLTWIIAFAVQGGGGVGGIKNESCFPPCGKQLQTLFFC